LSTNSSPKHEQQKSLRLPHSTTEPLVTSPAVAWELVLTDQVLNWVNTLTDQATVDRFIATTDLLAAIGPSLGRPKVDNIHSSRHSNMKELRVGNNRILFAFDPNRTAILLVAGDKANDWERWYKKHIPIADDLYDEHLEGMSR
jgi:hypothetical protein